METAVYIGVQKPEGILLQEQLKDMGIDALKQNKEELGIPVDIDMGPISVTVNYLMQIRVSGESLQELYDSLKPVAEKLGYPI